MGIKRKETDMSNAKIVNTPKIVMYTVSCGGDQGESTLPPFFSWEEAWEKLSELILGCWGISIHESCKGDIARIYRIKQALKAHMTFKPDAEDGTQNYLFNGSQCIPLDFQDEWESSWWWITKHLVDLPENLVEKN